MSDVANDESCCIVNYNLFVGYFCDGDDGDHLDHSF